MTTTYLAMLVCYILTIYLNSTFASESNRHDNSDSRDRIANCNDIDSSSNEIFFSKLCGDLILPTDGDIYLTAKRQYASLALPQRIHPSMIVEARCDEDIKSVISYAKKCDFTIVIRSGGHQYSGLSSCNDSCIQIDMSQYNEIGLIGEQNINMQPGVSLKQMYHLLDTNNLNLPGGECDSVNIGGHVQTGGFGHSMRSTGVLLDYVKSFDIILSDANTYHITKPDTNTNTKQTNQFNDDLFWAVMGGNPGSWGVITNFEFVANKNQDFSLTTIKQCFWPYFSELLKLLYYSLMEVQNDPYYLENPHYTLWWKIIKREPLASPNIMMIECVWIGFNNEQYDSTICDKILASSIAEAPILSDYCTTTELPLSTAHKDFWAFADTEGMTYVTQHRGSSINLTPEFIDKYVQALDQTFLSSENGLFPVSQMVSAGGSGSRIVTNDPDSTITSFPERAFGSLFIITDFIQYSEELNADAKQLANEWIDNTWRDILESKLFNNGVDIRQMFLTFGNLNMEQVWQYYYPVEIYQRLRHIKTRVDGINLFHNSFTIPPVNDDDDSDDDDNILAALIKDNTLDNIVGDTHNARYKETVTLVSLGFSSFTLINVWMMVITFVAIHSCLIYFICVKNKKESDYL